MRLRPLTGQVLVEILPAATRSAGGIDLPNHTPSPEENQESARRPQMPPGVIGVVVEVGPWPKLKNGMLKMPEFSRGWKVIVAPRSGLDLTWGTGARLKMVRNDQVLAILT